MNIRKQLSFGAIVIASILLLTTSCKKDDPEYTGTLTVLQKDAYSEVAGRTSELWPPHTTTVFEWDKGKEIHINHGTHPDETDANGDVFLQEVKVYTFTGTESEIEDLQDAYVAALYDDVSHPFLNLDNGTGVLEQTFLSGFRDYIYDGANGLEPLGLISLDELIAFFDAGEYHLFGAELVNFSWQQNDWDLAINTVLEDVLFELGENIAYYHVCNDDASLQVDLIKHFIATGEIEMPPKPDNGPMMYYMPE